MPVDGIREIALKIIYEINEKQAYSNISVAKHLENSELRSTDRAFITDLVYGTTRWKLTIDWCIELFSNIKYERISPWILNILRMGIYQLLYCDRIPRSAACNESVKLAKKYGHCASSGYVNALLRNVVTNKDRIPYPDKDRDLCSYLSIRHSHPQWMVDMWLKRYGTEFTESLLEANNRPPAFTVRVNTLKTGREQLIKTLGELGICAQRGRYAEEAVIIKDPLAVTRLDLYREGCFQIQDESSMLVSKILDPKPEELVIDACSAPGGKTAHIAQLMGNRGTVVARDIHAHKIKLLEETVKRLELKIVKPELYDAQRVDERYVKKADRVLVDAPCTGLGIIRRRPDIKWSRREEDKGKITALQLGILMAASKYVKPGGVLVYSTCTIEPEENLEMVMKFTELDGGFIRDDITRLSPPLPAGPGLREGYIQLYPNIDETDGFFIARLLKRR